MNKLTLIAFLFLSLSACLPKIPGVSLPILYKNDIHQGSILERFKINQLKLGMSKDQVQNLIGSPSIIDTFHNNQWDYINHSTLHKKDDIHYRLILKFNNNNLIHINTSGINSLSQLTDKERKIENKRIRDKQALEKAKVVVEITEEKALSKAKILKSDPNTLFVN